MELDKYLKQNGITRYRLGVISGITHSTWGTVAKNDLNKLSTRHLIAIGNAVGKSAGQVLDELLELELEADGLNGLGKVLDEYNYRNVVLEAEIKRLLDELNEAGVNVLPFTFNRLEADNEPDLDKVMNNIIESLKAALQNVKQGNPPFPE